MSSKRRITKENIHNILELTPMQQGLLFLYLMNPDSNEYIEQIVMKVKGDLDQDDIKNVWRHLISSYDCLRTVFKWDNLKSPVQVVLKEMSSSIYEETTEEDFEIALEKIKSEEMNRGVDLESEPYRIYLLKNSIHETTIILTYHHILWDGWSNGILIEEFKKICRDIIRKKAISTEKKYSSFSEYIKLIRSRDIEKERRYWEKYLRGYEQENMFNGIPEMKEKGKSKKVQFLIDGEGYKNLKEICLNNRHTIAGWLHAGLGLTLNKYSRNEDIVFGSTVSGRNINLPGIEKTVGLFINTLPMRVKLEENIRVNEVIKKVEKDIKERTNYEATPISTIKECSSIKGNEVLFDIILVYENYPFKKENNGEIEVEVLSVKEETNFGMNITVIEKPKDILEITISYKEDKYSESFVNGFLQHYKRVILDMIRCYDLRVEEIEALDKEERHQLQVVYNDTVAEYPKEKTIQELFEGHVEKAPNKIALTWEDKKLTYKELNERANSLARVLRDKGVDRDSIVGIMVEKSLEMVVGIMAILKAGGAYLPIDPSYPQERIEYMLEDSQTDILLTKEKLADTKEFNADIINLGNEDLYNNNLSNLNYINSSTDLAYIIYTSGSTGRPKGVMVEHKSLINFLYTMRDRYNKDIGVEDNCLSLTNISFDVSVAEIFLPLVFGGRLVLFNTDGLIEITKLSDLIVREKITFAYIPPTILWDVCDLLKESKQEVKLNKMLVGVEPIKDYVLEEFLKLNKKMKIINGYGPTEATICATMYIYGGKKITGENVPIGKPLNNIHIYILDKWMKLVPAGVPGELYISGDGLARGYLNRQKLTEEKFIESPFEKGARMYKTGDLARWLGDGNIEFLGRIDNQVKIRGYRIELGEIENVILKESGVGEVVVLSRKDKTDMDYLCAYIVKKEDVSTSRIKENIEKELPDYMIPNVFIELDKIPITANGKINRKALLEMETTITRERKYEGARNEIEARLIKLWEEILCVDGIGINDNFFDLGGHSLKATILSGRIQKDLEMEITVRDIFECSDIKALSERIKERIVKEYEELLPLNKQDSYPVSSAQRRIYTIQMMDKESIAYNMSLTLELKGNVNRGKIEKAIDMLIAKHESLRTSFHLDRNEIVQRIREEVKLNLDYAQAEEKEEIDKIIEKWIKPFNLDKAPLLRGGIIETKDSHILILDMHHIISDGTTMAVLAEDFVRAYEGIDIGTEPVQYKEYAAWEKRKREDGLWDKQKEYWKKTYEGEIPVLELPIDGTRRSIEDNNGETISFEIEGDIVNKLKKRMSDIGGTLYMGLMAGYSILLSKYSGQEDIVIGTAVAGRRHTQMERIAGMFVNTLPIRNCPVGEKSIEEYLRETKQRLLAAYENQDYSYEELVEELGVKGDLSRNPLFDVMLVLQNMDFKDIKLKDLEVNLYKINSNRAKFDITLSAMEKENKLLCEIEYKSTIFNSDTAENMIKHYIRVIDQIASNEKEKIDDIKLLNEDEKRRVLYDFNNTEVEYERNKTINELFEEQAIRTPNNTAVVSSNNELTYLELNERANKLARVLINRGIRNQDIVGLIADKSVEMIIGIIGILKAGAAYLPIPPEYPKERIEFMLQDSHAKLLLTNTNTFGRYECGVDTLNINSPEARKEECTNLINNNDYNSLAYIMYTSGTTGFPKGVMVEHRNVIRLINNTNYIEFNENDRILQTGSIAFDASTFEIWGALLNGLELHLVEEDVILDADKFGKTIESKGITTLWLTAPLFNELANYNPKIFRTLKYLLVGGDVLNPSAINKVIENCKGIKIVNGYGPTENTTFSTTFLIDKKYERSIPIGKPINNSKVYIVDKNMNLKPVKVPGELFVAGDGVARGYLNRNELTKEKFVNNPFEEGTRMYRTGDLARWLSDGNIEFLGRADNQVKIRGYRVELGEIENIIRKQAGVKEVVVLAKEDEDGYKYLSGYIVKEEGTEIETIREAVKKELPKHMMPSAIIEIDKVPLTSNGKIDRKVLLDMEVTISRNKEYEAPQNEIEERLVEIWEDILKIKKIGVHDDFFDLGGHSLKATILSARIQRELEVEASVKDIFECPNIRELSHRIEESSAKKYEELTPLKKQESYPVSSAQRRIYAIQMMDKENTAYNIPLTLELRGEVDRDKIERAIEKIIAKHEALRTSFHLDGGEIVQKIHDNIDLNLKYTRLEEKEEIDKVIEGWIKPFNLEKAPLLRSGIIETKDNHILLLDMHHIISDGTTMTLLAEDFVSAYEGIELIAQPIQYKEYAVWEKQQKEEGVWDRQKEYWKQEYEGEIPVLELPMDGTRGRIEDNKGERIKFEIDTEALARLKETVKEVGGTLYMGLMAGFSILLSRYSGQEDIVIGSPIAGRRHAQMEKVAGMFVNTLAIRTQPEGEKKVKEYLKEVKQKLVEVYENQEYPYEELVEEVQVRRDLSRNPLFDVMLVLQNTEMKEMKLPKVQINPYEIDNKNAQFDITLNIEEVNDKLLCEAEYKSKLYSRETIARMVRHYTRILNGMGEKKDKAIKEIELLDKEENEQLLKQFNNTRVEYNSEKTVIELFEKQVLETPENIALVFGEEKLTYKELNQRVNQLAWKLRDKGIKSETIVAIMTEPSLEMIIGLLGILKAGGAYMPVDPEYPADRIAFMFKDSGANILLTQEHLMDRVTLVDETIVLDDESVYIGDQSNANYASKSSDLAYIIYTSGSTGKPKGVMVEHRNIVAYVTAFKKEFSITSRDVVLQQATYCFDAFVEEVYPILTTGGKLVLAPKYEILDRNKLEEIIYNHDINIISCSPLFMNEINELNSIGNIHTLISGGDVLKQGYVTNLIGCTRIYNTYGPTETTVCASYYKCEEKTTANIPIGKPISNYRAYILDKNNSLQPIGVPGELCISGDGLTRGYLNRPELTAERFVENPYELGERMYKTGDLVRWLPDGNIEFLGRIDQQVKIRGYRIELGEVENVLRKQTGVKEAVVLDREDNTGVKYLCGYIVKNEAVTMEEIKEGAQQELPDYMMPSAIVEIESIPLTSSGKIDQKNLLNMEVTVLREKEYEPPINEMEERIAKVWEDILKIDKIGVFDNFFDLGGHSLKATVLGGRIQRELDVEVTVKDIFECPNIRMLSERIKERASKKYEELKPLGKQESYPVSSTQRRLYAIQMMDKNSTVYNMTLSLELKGKVDRAKIQGAIEKLISKHEALRTSFHFDGEEIVQKIEEDVQLELDYIKIEEKSEIDSILTSWIKPFNLEKAPLLRGGIIETRDSHILMLDMHHTIGDGATMGILAEDFVKAYEGIELKVEPVQYKEYALWEKIQKEKGLWDKQKEYWKKEYEGEIPVLELHMDGTRGGMENNEGDRIRFEIDTEALKNLKEIAKGAGGTLYMCLLAGFSILLSKYSGQEDIVIGSPIAGRRHAQMEKVAGMFVNTLAIRTQPEGEKKVKEYLKEMKQKLIEVYENQEYPYEELVEEVNVRRDLSRNPLFDVMLVLQNTEMKEMHLPNMEIKPYEIENRNAQFDITLNIEEDKDRLLCEAEYKSKLYSRETIERMMKHYIKILKNMVEKKDKTIKEIELLVKEEKEQLLKQFDNTKNEYDKEKTIVNLFEEQVEKTPENIAVVYGEERLSYGELNRRANLLSWKLKKAGLGQEKIAAIIMDADIPYIVGILGILKAGGVYLPILPDYPKERIEFMLMDSNALCVVKQSNYRLGEYQGLIVDIDKDIDENIGDKPKNINNTKAQNAAYVLYTSGSTGKPKGVIIEHRNVANQIIGLIEDYGYGKMKNQMLYSKPIFDVSVQHIFTALCSGAALHLMTEELKSNYNRLYQYVKKNKIEFIDMVPAQMEAMVEALEEDCRDIRLVLGGEAFPPQLLQRITERAKLEGIYNVYGPTETTINALIYKCRVDEIGRSVPIGKPVRNYGIYILNKYNQLQPMGIPGELCIVGEGVARGYLNRPELTEERFVESPLEPGRRMYRTGDLVRWMPDGNIEFLGRIDKQVKIRGYRIELGEIEKVLRNQKGVKETVVLDREDSTGGRYLCGYIVKEEIAVTMEAIKEGVQRELPDYMMPRVMVELEKIPLTNSGKIDRRVLLNMEVSISREEKYEAPRNEVEEQLAKIWEDVLGVEKIGIYDNFFDLGGHSIKAIKLLARIHKALNTKLDYQTLFSNPCISDIAGYIYNNDNEQENMIQPLEAKRYYETSYVQKRMWLLKQLNPSSTAYNMPGEIIIQDENPEEAIEAVLNALVKKHESFRTAFVNQFGEILQTIDTYSPMKLKIEDLTCFDQSEKKEKLCEIKSKVFNTIFDLGKSPLFRCKCIKMNDRYYEVVFCMHHIISDGWSMEIIKEEFDDFYRLYKLDNKVHIEPIRIQYKEFAWWQNRKIEKDIDKAMDYWKGKLDNYPEKLKLPEYMDNQLSDNDEYCGFLIEDKLFRDLNRMITENRSSLFSVLLSSLYVLLYRVTRQNDIVIGSAASGREHYETEDIVGCFVNTLLLREEIVKEEVFNDFLKKVGDNVSQVLTYQTLPLELILEKLGIQYPEIQVFLNVLNINEKNEIEANSHSNYSLNMGVKFDIVFYVIPSKKGIRVVCEYKRDKFKNSDIQFLSNQYMKIIEEITHNKHRPIFEIANEKRKRLRRK